MYEPPFAQVYKEYLDVASKFKKKLKDDKFVFTVYSSEFYSNFNGYLRDQTFFEKNPYKRLLPIEDINSIIFCIQDSLKKNRCVKDGTILYRGVGLKFGKDIGIGSQFYFREFISSSRDREQAERFSGNAGSILTIKIKNNKKRNYCFDIADYSLEKKESEVLISSFCHFIVTKIERNEQGLDEIHLDCEGFLLDKLLNKGSK